MDVFYNNCFSLPQQVNINKENIERLEKSSFSNVYKVTLLHDNWRERETTLNGILYYNTVDVPNMTETTIAIVTPRTFNDTNLPIFARIIGINTLNGKADIYSSTPLDSDIDIEIKYNIISKEVE